MTQSFTTPNTVPLDVDPLSVPEMGQRLHNQEVESKSNPSINLPPPLELQMARQKYQYDYTHMAPIAMIHQLPVEEIPCLSWWTKVIRVMMSIFVNASKNRRDHWAEEHAHHHVAQLLKQTLVDIFLQGTFQTRWRLLWHFLTAAPQLFWKGFTLNLHEWEEVIISLISGIEKDILLALHGGLKSRVDQDRHCDVATSLEDYNRQFSALALPEIATYFQEDEYFAYLRIAGPNPTMIERVQFLFGDILSQKFPVNNAHYQAVMGKDDSLEQALVEGRLYLADYAILAGAINGTYPGTHQKFIDAPQALFAIPPAGSTSQNLRPVAIQCSQIPGPATPIITPVLGHDSENYVWERAKSIVQVADTNYHEAVVHLAHTHLFIGPFVMATHRQFLSTHPLSILLRPHFEGTLNINNGAQSLLMAPKGGVDTTLAATIDCARALAVTGVQTHGFNAAMLPKQLEQRGVANPETFPIYPYRDDALLLWQAIQDWVSDYLHLYYADDAAVQQDQPLQNWATELIAFDGGRVVDFGEEGGIQTLAYLIEAVTMIIFTASAQHAAVNFPQGDIMVYSPAMPLAGYTPAPTQMSATEQSYFEQLPPLHQAQEQLELTYLLGQVYHTVLGQYQAGWFQDQQVQVPLQVFQERLQGIEVAIATRNQTRPYPYSYLLPSKIPQSINI